MTKKIHIRAVALLAAVAMLLTMLPGTGFAKTSARETDASAYYAEKYSCLLVRKGGTMSLRKNSTTVQSVREEIRENLDSTWEMSVEDKTRYCSAVWQEMQAAYTSECDRLDQAEDLSDMVAFEDGELVLSDQSVAALETIMVLGQLTREKVRSHSDIKTLRRNLRNVMKSLCSQPKRYFNTYYREMLSDKKAEASRRISHIKTFTDYALIFFYIVNIPPEDEDDYDTDDVMHFITGGKKAVTGSAADVMFIGDPAGIFTKRGVSMFRKASQKAVSLYIRRQLKISHFYDTAKLKKARAKAAALEKKTAKQQDVLEITRACRSTLQALERMTGVPYEDATEAQRVLAKKRINALLDECKYEDYSDDGWEEIEDIIDEDAETASGAVKYAEVYGLVKKAKAKIGKVPTKKQELRAAKKRYSRKLKRYLGDRRYDQKKVRPIVKKGVHKIRQCKTISAVSKVYKKYNALAKKTRL
jgi:hypothetical protein